MLCAKFDAFKCTGFEHIVKPYRQGGGDIFVNLLSKSEADVVALDRDIHSVVTTWHLSSNIPPERRCIVGW